MIGALILLIDLKTRPPPNLNLLLLLCSVTFLRILSLIESRKQSVHTDPATFCGQPVSRIM